MKDNNKQYFAERIKKQYQNIQLCRNTFELVLLVNRYYELCDIVACLEILTDKEIRLIETHIVETNAIFIFL